MRRILILFGLIAGIASGQPFWDSHNAYKLRGVPISTTAPTNTQVLQYNSSTGQWEATTLSGAGLGDVSGPASSTDNQVVLFDSTTGKLIKASTLTAGVVKAASGVLSAAAGSDLPTHASRHQNGGADEIATATAGANAIPKAGAGGTLAAGWIPDLSGTYQPLDADLTTIGGLAKTDDNLMVANGSAWELKALPSCSNATTSKLLYNSTTNAFSCGTDQDSGAGGGATTYNDLANWKVVRTDDDTLTIACTTTDPCTAEKADGTVALISSDIVADAITGSGDLRFEWEPVAGAVHVLRGTGVTDIGTCTNCTEGTGTAFTADRRPIYQWSTASDVLDATGTGYVAQLNGYFSEAGTGLTRSGRTISIDSTVVTLAAGTQTDDNILVGNGSAWQSKALPDCDDSGGNHLNYDTGTNAFSCGTSGGAGGGAPADAAYIVKTADGTLSAEFALGSLATGILKNTTTTGDLSIAVAADIPAAGSSNDVQVNSSNVLGAATGLTWDNTNKILQSARSNAAGTGGYMAVRNSGTLTVGNAVLYNLCVASGQCDYAIYNHYNNLDGAGATTNMSLWDNTNSFRFLAYTAVNTRLYLGRAAESGGSNIVTTGANAVIARTSASAPFTFVVGAGGSQSTSPLFDMVSNNGATVYNRFGPAGLVETYGSRTGAGRGLGLIMAQYKPSALSAAVTSGNLLASAPVGTYRVSTYIHTLTVPSAACTATVTLGWTYNGGAKTKTVVVAHDLNTDENSSDDTTVIDVDASTNITRAISNDGTCGTYTYDVSMILENLR